MPRGASAPECARTPGRRTGRRGPGGPGTAGAGGCGSPARLGSWSADRVGGSGRRSCVRRVGCRGGDHASGGRGLPGLVGGSGPAGLCAAGRFASSDQASRRRAPGRDRRVGTGWAGCGLVAPGAAITHGLWRRGRLEIAVWGSGGPDVASFVPVAAITRRRVTGGDQVGPGGDRSRTGLPAPPVRVRVIASRGTPRLHLACALPSGRSRAAPSPARRTLCPLPAT